MPTTTITVRGLDKLNQKLSLFGTGVRPMLERTTKEAVIYAWSQIPKYPRQSHKPMIFVSEKQKLFVFWLIGQGLVPYKRTVQLFRSITAWAGSAPGALSRVESLFGEVLGIIGTSLEYAPWVIDRDRQAEYHKDTWWTLQDVIVKAKPGIKRVYEKGVHDFTRKIFP